MLRWRTRKKAAMRSRFLHLLHSQVALAVLVKGRSSSWRLNRVLCSVNALTLAALFFPCWAYVRIDWNASDSPSRLWEGKRPARRSAYPRRRRVTKTVHGQKAQLMTARRNQTFEVYFDATKAHPGEGPRPRVSRARSLFGRGGRLSPQRMEQLFSKRTRSERVKARKGIAVKSAILNPRTLLAYQTAFAELWSGVGPPRPATVASVEAYDAFLSELYFFAGRVAPPEGKLGTLCRAAFRLTPN